jgi:hypothetical protein
MIPKNGFQFSGKIMLKQQAKGEWPNLKPFRFSLPIYDVVGKRAG